MLRLFILCFSILFIVPNESKKLQYNQNRYHYQTHVTTSPQPLYKPVPHQPSYQPVPQQPSYTTNVQQYVETTDRLTQRQHRNHPRYARSHYKVIHENHQTQPHFQPQNIKQGSHHVQHQYSHHNQPQTVFQGSHNTQPQIIYQDNHQSQPQTIHHIQPQTIHHIQPQPIHQSNHHIQPQPIYKGNLHTHIEPLHTQPFHETAVLHVRQGCNHGKGEIVWPWDGHCVILGQRGPCPQGLVVSYNRSSKQVGCDRSVEEKNRLLLQKRIEIRPKCDSNTAYDEKTRQCFLPGVQGPCQQNEIFMLRNEGKGECEQRRVEVAQTTTPRIFTTTTTRFIPHMFSTTSSTPRIIPQDSATDTVKKILDDDVLDFDAQLEMILGGDQDFLSQITALRSSSDDEPPINTDNNFLQNNLNATLAEILQNLSPDDENTLTRVFGSLTKPNRQKSFETDSETRTLPEPKS